MTGKRLRQTLRVLHVIAGVSMILLVYSPLREDAGFLLANRIAIVPLITLSGLALWQQAKLQGWLGRRR